MKYENNPEIQLLREYLRFPTVHPNIEYDASIELILKQAEELNLESRVFTPSKSDIPIVILTWKGLKPDLPAIMLNSHMDVASVFPKNWIYLPFSAHLDENGIIYGRGVQDSKSVGIQYLAAVRALKNMGFHGQRTLYITYMPDEENGGRWGMRSFVATNLFRTMNIGFALDGGLASPENDYKVFYAERTKCQMGIRITGSSGSAAFLPKGSVGEKFNFIMKKFRNLREKEMRSLSGNNNITLGDVTTINLTMCNSSENSNELPTTIDAFFDIRLSRKVNPEQFFNQLNQWGTEAGGGIDIISIDTDFITAATSLDETNKFWKTFKRVCEEEKITITPCVLPSASDSRFLRNVNIPALNFSPMPNTPNLAHADNEYLSAETFLKGIEFYKKIIPALLNNIPDDAAAVRN